MWLKVASVMGIREEHEDHGVVGICKHQTFHVSVFMRFPYVPAFIDYTRTSLRNHISAASHWSVVWGLAGPPPEAPP
jgi:hypothetical protein